MENENRDLVRALIAAAASDSLRERIRRDMAMYRMYRFRSYRALRAMQSGNPAVSDFVRFAEAERALKEIADGALAEIELDTEARNG